MDFLALSLRVAADAGCIYRGWSYSDEVTEADRAVLDAVFAKHVPEAVDSMFNNWRVYGAGSSFYAMRATWTMGNDLHAPTADDLATKIEEYYNR